RPCRLTYTPLRRVSSLRHAAPAAPYTLSLHDALPISRHASYVSIDGRRMKFSYALADDLDNGGITITGLNLNGAVLADAANSPLDRKSTRLNSSHVKISYAVFCLKKKTNDYNARSMAI